MCRGTWYPGDFIIKIHFEGSEKGREESLKFSDVEVSIVKVVSKNGEFRFGTVVSEATPFTGENKRETMLDAHPGENSKPLNDAFSQLDMRDFLKECTELECGCIEYSLVDSDGDLPMAAAPSTREVSPSSRFSQFRCSLCYYTSANISEMRECVGCKHRLVPTLYCSKRCQVQDWQRGHEKECRGK